MLSQNQQKKAAAEAALSYVEDNTIIGIGTGSTTNFFIAALAKIKHRIEGTVASSEASAQLLKAQGIPVYDLNAVGDIPLYVDGADEVDSHLNLIKGGGGALTREKIIAAAARQFICIVDPSKMVETLGQFPLPIEVIPMARSYVGRAILKLGGNPIYRSGFTTDNGNIIIDVEGLQITQPKTLEDTLNNITGVVTVGLFARRPADVVLIGAENKVITRVQ